MPNSRNKAIRGNQINWNQVYYFSRIANAGSIKEAALELGLSSPTLSEHLSQLEENLAVQLFVREFRKLRLTDAGAKLYRHARQMFESSQRWIDTVSPIPLGCYPVAVGLVPSTSIQEAYKVIGAYIENFPKSNMKVHSSSREDLERGLLEATYDFGFSDQKPERKDIVHQLLSSSPLSFYVSTEWAEGSFRDLLTKLPLLVCHSNPDQRTLVEYQIESVDLSPLSIMTTAFPSLAFDLCQRGLGIGVFCEDWVKRMNRNTLLRSLRAPKDAPRIHDRLYLLWSKDGENSEAVQNVKEILKTSS